MLKGCFKFFLLFIVIIIALILWPIISMPTASREDFKNNRENYNKIVQYILRENGIDNGELPPEGLNEGITYRADIKKLIEKSEIMNIRINYDNILFIKRMIPPDYYQGYRYLVDDNNTRFLDYYRIEKNWLFASDG